MASPSKEVHRKQFLRASGLLKTLPIFLMRGVKLLLALASSIIFRKRGRSSSVKSNINACAVGAAYVLVSVCEYCDVYAAQSSSTWLRMELRAALWCVDELCAMRHPVDYTCAQVWEFVLIIPGGGVHKLCVVLARLRAVTAVEVGSCFT